MFIARCRGFGVIPKGLYVLRNDLCPAFTYNPFGIITFSCFGGYKHGIPSGFWGKLASWAIKGKIKIPKGLNVYSQMPSFCG